MMTDGRVYACIGLFVYFGLYYLVSWVGWIELSGFLVSLWTIELDKR